MQLLQNLPEKPINLGEQMKFYTWALQKPLLDILDTDGIQKLSMKKLNEVIPETRHITFIRHLESKYNEYKELIKQNLNYINFMKPDLDPQEKERLAQVLLKDFFEQVGIDYETNISEQGKKQGEQLWKLYAELIGEHPELFPDLIYVSPYLRTRLTANYLLKDIKGLDINFDHLTDEEQLQDLILGSFNGRDITIKIEERIRERDHGGNIAPNYVRDYLEGKKNATHLLSKTQKNKLHYYTAPEGGESQVEVNARTREFLSKIYQKEEYKNILIVSHHLTIISALMSIFGGSFNSFTDIDENRRPRNGSFTFLSEIPKTEMGRENKFRVSGYNLSLEE